MNTSCSTRSNGFKIYKKFNKTSIRRFAFSLRIINNWNSLPYEIATSPNVLSFKTNLDHFLYNHLYDLIEIGFIRLCLLFDQLYIIIIICTP